MGQADPVEQAEVPRRRNIQPAGVGPLQLSGRRRVLGGMKTFLKIVLFSVLVLVLIKVFPVLLAPAFVAAAVMLVVGAVALAGLGAVVAAGLTAALFVLAIFLVVAAVLSPVWLPILALVGFISLLRRQPKTA